MGKSTEKRGAGAEEEVTDPRQELLLPLIPFFNTETGRQENMVPLQQEEILELAKTDRPAALELARAYRAKQEQLKVQREARESEKKANEVKQAAANKVQKSQEQQETEQKRRTVTALMERVGKASTPEQFLESAVQLLPVVDLMTLSDLQVFAVKADSIAQANAHWTQEQLEQMKSLLPIRSKLRLLEREERGRRERAAGHYSREDLRERLEAGDDISQIPQITKEQKPPTLMQNLKSLFGFGPNKKK